MAETVTHSHYHDRPQHSVGAHVAGIDDPVLRCNLVEVPGQGAKYFCEHGTTTPDNGGNGGCFIVTAATGSPQSEEITRLRGLRDRVSAASGLGAQLIDAIYDEYHRFSPSIAAELEDHAAARQGVLWVVVKPLVAWYALAGKLALESADQDSIRQAVKDATSACPRFLGPSSIAAWLQAIRAGEELPADCPQPLLDFAPRIREAARFPLASWAILDPLERVWTCAARHLDPVDEVSQWLATAPLDQLPPPRRSQQLEAELKTLSSFLSFRPLAREQLGQRLMQAWPHTAAAHECVDLIPQRRASVGEFTRDPGVSTMR